MIKEYNCIFQIDETNLSQKHSRLLVKQVKLDFLYQLSVLNFIRECIPISLNAFTKFMPNNTQSYQEISFQVVLIPIGELIRNSVLCYQRFHSKQLLKFRSSHRRCSLDKGVLKHFAKFTGKHLCQSLFLNKVAGLRFFFQNSSGRLLLLVTRKIIPTSKHQQRIQYKQRVML